MVQRPHKLSPLLYFMFVRYFSVVVVSSELLVSGEGVCSILLLPLEARDNICMYMAHVCFYLWCSDCVGICGNVCCVTAVVKYSVEVWCKFVKGM